MATASPNAVIANVANAQPRAWRAGVPERTNPSSTTAIRSESLINSGRRNGSGSRRAGRFSRQSGDDARAEALAAGTRRREISTTFTSAFGSGRRISLGET